MSSFSSRRRCDTKLQINRQQVTPALINKPKSNKITYVFPSYADPTWYRDRPCWPPLGDFPRESDRGVSTQTEEEKVNIGYTTLYVSKDDWLTVLRSSSEKKAIKSRVAIRFEAFTRRGHDNGHEQERKSWSQEIYENREKVTRPCHANKQNTWLIGMHHTLTLCQDKESNWECRKITQILS